MLPKISVVTVSYNQGQFIEANIRSVIAQDYENIEHIVIDGGSTDDTVCILKRYPHINWVSEADGGQSEALNKGFRKVTGQIVAWVNSDDKLAPGALNKVASYFLKNPGEYAVVGNQAIIDSSGTYMRVNKPIDYDYDYLLNVATGITQNSIFFKSAVFSKIGWIDESLHFAMDHDFFIRVATLGTIKHIDEVLAEFRLHGESKTSGGTYRFAKELLIIIKKYHGKTFGSAGRNDLYLIITQPLREIAWLRRWVQSIRKI